jgi:3-hydroxyacyl-[acyl-carrier-protein] dehydratase
VRYLLLDRITLLNPPQEARAIKCISLSDDIFLDHFPGHPIMPGALIIESMAQLAGVLAEASMRERGRHDLHALLVMSDKARFRRAVSPGDKLELTARLLRCTEDGAQLDTTAHVDGEIAATASLSFAFASVTHEVLLSRRREVLDIWLHGSIAGDSTKKAFSGP